MSLQQPLEKMSKSHADHRSRILITDSADEIEKKIMSALTDSQNWVSYDPKTRPGVSNLINLLSVLDEEGRGAAELAASFHGSTLKDLKLRLIDAVITNLAGVRERFIELLSADDGQYLDFIEANGAKRARASAEETIQIVREATGL
jgi:tryptophanyl-tRNA synthetase